MNYTPIYSTSTYCYFLSHLPSSLHPTYPWAPRPYTIFWHRSHWVCPGGYLRSSAVLWRVSGKTFLAPPSWGRLRHHTLHWPTLIRISLFPSWRIRPAVRIACILSAPSYWRFLAHCHCSRTTCHQQHLHTANSMRWHFWCSPTCAIYFYRCWFSWFSLTSARTRHAQ